MFASVRKTIAIAVPIAAFFGVAASAHAQTIRGQVVLEGWGEPVGDSRVTLLDQALLPLDSIAANDEGWFAFTGLETGIYYLQASMAGSYSSLSDPVEVIEGAETDPVVLMFQSSLYRQAIGCLVGGVEPGTGVLAGVAYEADTQIPLPGARVSIEWDPGDRPGGSRADVVTDAGGRFVFCGVPADVPITAWTHAIGRVSPGRRGIVVGDGVVAREDLAIRLDVATSLQVVRDARRGAATDPADLTGRLLDSATGQPVVAATVRLSGVAREQVTDDRGRFRFDAVPPGSYNVEVQHLGYGRQSEPLELPGGADVTVELSLAARAVELDGITVTARAERGRVTIGGARPSHTLSGLRLAELETRGTSLADALYQIPGLRVNYGRIGGSGPMQMCVEAIRAGRSLTQRTCNSIVYVVDGVVVPRDEGQRMLSMGIADYESIEFLPPLAAIRWGMEATEVGALVITTKSRAQRQRRD